MKFSISCCVAATVVWCFLVVQVVQADYLTNEFYSSAGDPVLNAIYKHRQLQNDTDTATEAAGDDAMPSENVTETAGDENVTEPVGDVCILEEENDDDWCYTYISRLPPSNLTSCDCFDFCNGVLIGCRGFGEEPEGEYDCPDFPRYGCREGQEGKSAANKALTLWITMLTVAGSVFWAVGGL